MAESSKEESEEKGESEPQRIRRNPSVPVTITDLKAGIGRVAVLGTVVSKNDDIYSLVVDDGSGSVVVILNDMELYEKVEQGQYVRVLGRVFGEGDEIEIMGDIVQDFSKIDKELYKKVFSS